jgi:phosphoenolpyruvate-protein phosphotransferase/dihydroxyacetone kinase phosphotransfer subunit
VSTESPTVGLVVVSHSHALAGAAHELASEMLAGSDQTVRVALAAGLDETTFGTDATRISAAIEEVDTGAGAVVLMDIGSAVLSAEMALELLPEEQRDRVSLAPAPLVEGLLAATVAAAGGASRADVVAEAVGALAAKQEALGVEATGPAAATPEEAPAASAAPAGAPDGPQAVEEFDVTPAHGLHARPAARLVTGLADFDADVTLRNVTTDSGSAPARSLTRVAALGAMRGHRVELRAVGPEAAEAAAFVRDLAARNFDDVDAPPPPPSAVVDTGPLGASPGVAVGPGWRLDDRPVPEPDSTSEAASTGDPAAERAALRSAIDNVRAELAWTRDATTRSAGVAEAGIFDAHLLVLDDLQSAAESAISTGAPVASAWSDAVTAAARDLEAIGDDYMAGRAADVRAVGDQVIRALAGESTGSVVGDGILVAPDLTPAQAATLDTERTIGVVLAHSSPTAHAAILARARGVPMVVGAGAAALDIATGTTLAMDGGAGELVVDPDDDTRQRFAARSAAQRQQRESARERAHEPARTRDGVAVTVAANVASVDEARAAADAGADLAGLVRTEFVFVGRTTAPDVDEQEAVYLALAEAMGGRRVTIRTLDVGGDKPLDYVAMPVEANPFLGLRGIRLALAQPELLTDQLTAIVRAAHQTPISVMFPMVTSPNEVAAARGLLTDAIARVGRGEPDGLAVGIMIEVPAAALTAATFAPDVDFFSIGTNDLTQYALAAERGNEGVAGIVDPMHPAVLRLIEATCEGAGDRVTVAVCGELAADPQAVPTLVGLGVRELSVAAPAVPLVKEAVRETDLSEPRQ